MKINSIPASTKKPVADDEGGSDPSAISAESSDIDGRWLKTM